MPVTAEDSTRLPKKGKHNVSRAMRFRAKPLPFLKAISESGSLASAAAAFEVCRRAGAAVSQ